MSKQSSKKGYNMTRAIARANPGFTAAFAFFYILQAALTIWMLMLPGSIRNTLDVFMEDYNIPDAYIVTDYIDASVTDELKDIQGVQSVDARFLVDNPISLPDGKVITPRFVRISEDAFQKNYIYDSLADEELKDYNNMLQIMSSKSFADNNGLSVGDIIVINDREAVVSAIITNPDCIWFFRDETSWYDSTDFGLLFMEEDYFDEAFGTRGYANQFLLDIDKDSEAFDKASEKLGEYVVSAYLFEGSEVEKQINENIDTVTLIAYTLPMLILVVSILFSCLFIHQVIRRMSRMIGLMRASGCRFAEILRTFLKYICIIAFPSSAAGMVAGAILLVYTADVYKGIYSLPQINYSGNILLLILIPLITIGSGMLSCLICSGSIAKIKPAEAYNENTEVKKQKKSKWFEKINFGVYTKLAFGNIFHNPKRFLMSVLCISACFCLILVAVCFVFSKDLGGEITFNVRYKYDYIVYLDNRDEDELLMELKGLECIEKAESVYVFMEDISSDSRVVRVQINAISSESEMICPPDLHGNVLDIPESGIILEKRTAKELGVEEGDIISISGKEVRVEAISEQYVNPIQYCSYAQAKSLGYYEPDAVVLSVKEGTDSIDFSKQISKVAGYSYSVNLDNQKRDMLYNLDIYNIPAFIIAVFAVMAGLVSTYNMFIISTNEKKREYALMIVQGLSRRKLYMVTLVELFVQYICSCIISIACGLLVAEKMLEIMSLGGQEFPLVKTGAALIISAVITFIYILIGSFLTQKNIKNISLSSALNGLGK